MTIPTPPYKHNDIYVYIYEYTHVYTYDGYPHSPNIMIYTHTYILMMVIVFVMMCVHMCTYICIYFSYDGNPHPVLQRTSSLCTQRMIQEA